MAPHRLGTAPRTPRPEPLTSTRSRESGISPSPYSGQPGAARSVDGIGVTHPHVDRVVAVNVAPSLTESQTARVVTNRTSSDQIQIGRAPVRQTRLLPLDRLFHLDISFFVRGFILEAEDQAAGGAGEGESVSARPESAGCKVER